jgi:hypothetical protein
VEPSQPIVPIAELPAAATIEPASLERSSRLLRLRAGAELILVGAPYAGALRPTLGLGLSVARSATAPAWLFELQLSVLGSAELRRPGERLALTRHDGRLRAGLQLALGPLALAGLIHLRASLSQADYTGPTPVSNASLRLGLGAGVEADLELVRWLRIYADVLLDAATSRSEYRVGGTRWIRDPALILSAGLGLALVVPL